MDIFVARQAVLNNKQTVAYELLFREGSDNAYPAGVESKTATSRLILNHHLNSGFAHITGGRKALINFCSEGIIEQLPALVAPEELIIEILEDAEPSDELLAACQILAEKGYRLALDDFSYNPAWDRFLPYIRLIKFDLQTLNYEQIQAQLSILKKHKKLKFLAEKVETQQEFEQCKSLGFEFFQGYFFCQPEMMSGKDVSANYNIVVAILSEVLRPQFSFDRLTAHFELDVSLTYKLLKFINSSLFQLQEQVGSIKQALIYLGEEEARKFIALIATAHIAQEKPAELVRMSVVRARMCEIITGRTKAGDTDSGFLLGLFSLIDVILNKSMEDIVLSLPLMDEIKEALLGYKNSLFHIMQLIKAYESGSWYNTQRFANVVQIEEKVLPGIYQEALEWSASYETATVS
ncbi:EAL and HDOD domain-containing protein [Planctobacterium marinum]|uniref:EAL and HDOD domain-containing protein n=1 Tax=Planctobacterium marinum TaxID=1631968 RepID=UPI001E4A13E0|nr:HDOD domain-containing protein [Planctobacterium marinum]MCC2604406.1 HDOD domain-containing protein [Planctobacterium marinum]